MTQPTDSLDIKDLKDVASGGLVKEEVLDQIFGQMQIPTDFLDMIGTGSFSNNYYEWTEETLLSANASNAFSSGTKYEPATAAHGARVGNHAQISRRGVNVTDRAEASSTVGGSGKMGFETAYQIQGLRIDQEAIFLSNQASIADNPGTTVGKTAGLGAWLATNTQHGANGAAGGFNTSTKVVDTITPGNKRALSWEYVATGIANAYAVGARPSVLFSVPTLRKGIGRYLVDTGNAATLTAEVTGTQPVDMVSNQYVDSFKTDFGYVMKVRDSRHQDTYTAADTGDVAVLFGIDPQYVQKVSSYGVRVTPLAKEGDYDRKMIQEDWGTRVTLERAHFGIYDITPGATVVD